MNEPYAVSMVEIDGVYKVVKFQFDPKTLTASRGIVQSESDDKWEAMSVYYDASERVLDDIE